MQYMATTLQVRVYDIQYMATTLQVRVYDMRYMAAYNIAVTAVIHGT